MELTFHEGAWTGRCQGVEVNVHRTGTFRGEIDEPAGFAPLQMPTPTVLGVQMADPDGPPSILFRCGPGGPSELVAQEAFSIQTGPTGEIVHAWRARSPAPDLWGCVAEATFDVRVGLVLDWSKRCDNRFIEVSEGHVIATDAPLG